MLRFAGLDGAQRSFEDYTKESRTNQRETEFDGDKETADEKNRYAYDEVQARLDAYMDHVRDLFDKVDALKNAGTDPGVKNTAATMEGLVRGTVKDPSVVRRKQTYDRATVNALSRAKRGTPRPGDKELIAVRRPVEKIFYRIGKLEERYRRIETRIAAIETKLINAGAAGIVRYQDRMNVERVNALETQEAQGGFRSIHIDSYKNVRKKGFTDIVSPSSHLLRVPSSCVIAFPAGLGVPGMDYEELSATSGQKYYRFSRAFIAKIADRGSEECRVTYEKHGRTITRTATVEPVGTLGDVRIRFAPEKDPADQLLDRIAPRPSDSPDPPSQEPRRPVRKGKPSISPDPDPPSQEPPRPERKSKPSIGGYPTELH